MIYFQQVFDNTLIKVLSGVSIDIYKEFKAYQDPEVTKKVIEALYTPSQIKKYIREGRNYYLVMSNLTTIGHFSIEKHGARIFINEIYLTKDYRHKGIGSQILTWIKEVPNNFGYTTFIDKNNTEAIGFFNHHNFVESGHYKADLFTDTPVDCIIMDCKKDG